MLLSAVRSDSGLLLPLRSAFAGPLDTKGVLPDDH